MKVKIIVLSCLLFSSGFLLAQINMADGIGGSTSFRLLNLPSSSRQAALGGELMMIADNDVAQFWDNPALLNANTHRQAYVSSSSFFADSRFGSLGFGYTSEKLQTNFSAGLGFMNFGDFEGADAMGLPTNSFNGNDFVFALGASRKYSERITYGGNLKWLTSQLEGYSAMAIGADLGVHYQDSSGLFQAALVLKNIGSQISRFHSSANLVGLPFNVELGVSKQLAHMPFRISVTAHNLQKFDIRYNDGTEEEDNNLFGNTDSTSSSPKSNFADKVARHLIFGGEFLFGPSFRVRFGYNHLRRAEMSFAARRGLAGFSFGTALRISRFNIDYSLAQYHLGGASHQFTLATPVQRRKSKS